MGDTTTVSVPISQVGTISGLGTAQRRFEFANVQLQGPDWTTTLTNMWVEVSASDPNNITQSWGVSYSSPVQRDNHDRGGDPDVVWSIWLMRNGAKFDRAVFSGNFNRVCQWNPQSATGNQTFTKGGGLWPFSDTIVDEIANANDAELTVVFKTRVTWCK